MFQRDIEPTFILLPSCKHFFQPFKHNVVWEFLAKKRRHQTLSNNDEKKFRFFVSDYLNSIIVTKSFVTIVYDTSSSISVPNFMIVGA